MLLYEYECPKGHKYSAPTWQARQACVCCYSLRVDKREWRLSDAAQDMQWAYVVGRKKMESPIDR